MASRAGLFERILPRQIDNAYRGSRAAAARFALFLAVKLLMGVNSLINTRGIVTGPDALPTATYGPGGAQAVLSLFMLLARTRPVSVCPANGDGAGR